MDYNSVVSFVKEAQDYEQTLAMQEIQKDPAKFKAYTDQRKAQIKSDIFDAKESAFNKVYEDAKLAADNNNSVMYYYRRNKDLLDINNVLAKKALEDNDKIVFNDGLAKRHFELNEWEVQDKRDTLFMYQLGFISILSIVLLTLLKKSGLLGGGLYWYLCVFVVVVFVFTLLYRIIYTETVRDKFYWSRRKFGSMNAPPASGSGECPSSFDSMRATATNYASSSWNKVSDQLQSYEKYAKSFNL
jgi:hypothetical protein